MRNLSLRLSFIVYLASVIVFSSSVVFAQVAAERTLPGDVYIPGATIQVTIKVTGSSGAETVEETPPTGWTIVRVMSADGQVSEGMITWKLTSINETQKLNYYVTPPSDATDHAVFSGKIGDREIGGMSTMSLYRMPDNVRLPKTTGPYAIGTILVHLVDDKRAEKLTPKNPDDKRELMVQIWYPANIRSGGQPGLVYPGFEAIQPIMETSYRTFSLPRAYWDGVRALVGNAVWDAPVLDSGSPYPVLLYSHGDMAWRHCNVSLLEELASHGYVVASIDHTYNASAVLFPDGQVIVSKGTGDTNVHTQDVRFVLDRLEAIPAGSDLGILAGRLDLERIGVLGMSFGGSVMTQTLKTDLRFKAGVGLDGGEVQKFDRPVMFLWNTFSPGNPNQWESAFHAGGYCCQIPGSAHMDFSDYPLWWRLFSLPGKFSTSVVNDPIRMARILADYTVAFFDKTLKVYAVPLLAGPSPDYPEVNITIIGYPQGVSEIPKEEWMQY